MSDFREYSKVTNVERGFFDRRMFLKLDCGHEVYRYKKVPPKLVRCEFCHRPAWFPAVEHSAHLTESPVRTLGDACPQCGGCEWQCAECNGALGK